MHNADPDGRSDDGRLPGEESARLLLPRAGLAGLVSVAIVRDTRRLQLAPEQRYSYFPASPFCAASWVLEGQAHLADAMGLIDGEPLPPAFISGPYRRPIATWSPGPVVAMTVGFYPEAWRALTGLDAKALSGREWPLDAALSQELLPLFRAVAAAGDCERGFARLQDGLDPLWRDSRPQGLGPPWLEDWARGLVARAALSGPGKSARQIQRRVKAWTGQSQRDLQVHARVEAVFARTHAANDVSLSELAADMGYADQSHMGREVKRITGHSPAQISRLIATDERFWCYRLLGERF